MSHMTALVSLSVTVSLTLLSAPARAADEPDTELETIVVTAQSRVQS